MSPAFGPAARRDHARQIFHAGLAAADPRACIRRALAVDGNQLQVAGSRIPLDSVSQIVVVGAGKASAAMAAEAEEILGDRITAGSINTKYNHALPLQYIDVVECGHPVPDEAGVRGTQAILEHLAGLDEKDLVLCLLSGGGSALLPAPAEGLTLADKQETTQKLLASGASIDEVNAVRKHLSRVKGGLLARHAQPARLFALALSDVIGDPLGTIASGPAFPDSTTFADCQRIITGYGIRDQLPEAVCRRLDDGGKGRIPETPGPGDPCFERACSQVVGNNSLAVAAAEDKGRQLGYHTLVLTTRLQGEAREVAAALTAVGLEIAAAERPVPRPACVICGGETTVTLRGDGKGGRNQELALAAAMRLADQETVTLLSGGTDGTDGPTDAAGALADGATLQRARELELDAADFLARNDSYHFFQSLNDLLMTGPTQTNVMDLQVMLVG